MLGRLHHEKEPCGGGVLPTNYESSYFEMCGRYRSSEYAKGKMHFDIRYHVRVRTIVFSAAICRDFASPQTLLVNCNI